VLGFVGFLLLFYTVVSLLQKVERSFNYIWHVPTERSIAHKFRDYLSAVILGPLLVIGATGIIASLMSSAVMQSIAGFGPIGVLIEIVGRLTSLALVVGAMTFLYAFLPNTQVRLVPAALGGLVAGVLWVLTGWGFASFIVSSATYTVIYSAFATLVLFMIWLYLVWLIVLMGSAVSFYCQNPHYIGIKREAVQYGIKVMERVALIAVYHILRSWYKGEAPWTAERLARETHVPMPALSQVIGALEKAGLIERGGHDQQTLLPACPPEDTPVKAVIDALRADAGTGYPALGRIAAPDAVENLFNRMDRALSAEFERETLKSFALNGATPELMMKSAARESGGV
jgi:membrane protein